MYLRRKRRGVSGSTWPWRQRRAAHLPKELLARRQRRSLASVCERRRGARCRRPWTSANCGGWTLKVRAGNTRAWPWRRRAVGDTRCVSQQAFERDVWPWGWRVDPLVLSSCRRRSTRGTYSSLLVVVRQSLRRLREFLHLRDLSTVHSKRLRRPVFVRQHSTFVLSLKQLNVSLRLLCYAVRRTF